MWYRVTREFLACLQQYHVATHAFVARVPVRGISQVSGYRLYAPETGLRLRTLWFLLCHGNNWPSNIEIHSKKRTTKPIGSHKVETLSVSQKITASLRNP